MKENNINRLLLGYGMLVVIFLATTCIQGCKKNGFSFQEQVRQQLAYEMLKKDTSLSIAVEALEKAGIAPTLNTYGPFTFFAPDNNAFRNFFISTGKNSLADFTAVELKTLMVYHIMQARLKSSDFIQGPQPVPVGMGDFISLDISRGFRFNTIANSVAKIYQTDIEYSNGLVHKMDAVLNPPTLTIGQFLELNRDRYSIMIAGLRRANLWDTLTNLTDNIGNRIRLTLFAEPNEVWQAAGITTLDNMPLDQLDTLLRYHMVAGAGFSSSYTHKTEANATIGLVERWDSTIVTLNREQYIYFDLAATKLINDVANFGASDVIMRNGTLHVLDKHIEFNPNLKRTQIYHWFRANITSTFAYGLPGISPSQAPAINGSGRWRTFAENGREFLFCDPDGINDSMVTIVRNVRKGKYRIEASYKAGNRGTCQLMNGSDPIGAPTFLGLFQGTVNGGVYNQKLVIGTYNFRTTGDKRLNFVWTALPGVAFDNLVLTPEY